MILSCFFKLSHAQSFDTSECRDTLKVLSFNIYHGEIYYKTDANSKASNLEIVAALIDSLKPDLVALQEVDFKTKRVEGKDILTELACKTQMVPMFGKAMAFNGGEYGVGILSRFSLLKTETQALANEEGKEPRVALCSYVQTAKGKKIRFVATHLDHTTEELRLRQMQQIINAYAKDTIRTILTGDLNAVPGSETMQLAFKSFKATSNLEVPTIPSDKPEHKIDYILVRPANCWRVIESSVINEQQASDHNPVFSIIELRTKN
ncbi:endonuclease/exonuclease/phosphatase family protein [Carboxylicivirga sp. N1Y90]|uniref:endonuclease/exonuclease/phosphatase family protein n=1 Tax=Carboxylicivirga fragile TaxID=3417571 RepID=UPI003D3325B1|nr:endonuclease/exonuclease/phosphatase family protein [Marinilabiliaceae bacterium N1Y90]